MAWWLVWRARRRASTGSLIINPMRTCLGLTLVLLLGCSGDGEEAAGGGGGATSTTTAAGGGGGTSTSSSTAGSGATSTSTGAGGSGDGGDGAGGDGGASTTTAAGTGGGGGSDDCGAIGQACETECPDGLACEGRGPDAFCAPPAPECGGFAGTRCPESRPECLYYSGADFGLCATAADAQCICENAPNAVAGCD